MWFMVCYEFGHFEIYTENERIPNENLDSMNITVEKLKSGN